MGDLSLMEMVRLVVLDQMGTSGPGTTSVKALGVVVSDGRPIVSINKRWNVLSLSMSGKTLV